MFTDLSATAQTAYAQLVDAVQSSELMRCIADVPGSFNKKVVAGRPYWYYQSRDLSGSMRQTYLGPDNERLITLIAQRASALNNTPKKTSKALADHAIALGCEGIIPAHHRVISKLSSEGFFRAGGLLIGTHAFLAAGNMLGVKWGSGEQTVDLDYEHAGKKLGLALPSTARLDLHDAISALQMGFVPSNSLDGLLGGSWVNPKDPAFRLDFITAMDRTNRALVKIESFNAQFQALRYVEFSLEGVTQTVLFSRIGLPCLVSIPDPARMAVHKLIVSGIRSSTFTAKSTKDLAQAACLIAYYSDRDPVALKLAYDDAMSRGPSWRAAVTAGLSAISRKYPSLKDLTFSL